MDLLETPPKFELADSRWAAESGFFERLPMRICSAAEFDGTFLHGKNLVGSGCDIGQSKMVRSVLSNGVRVESSCELNECILFKGVKVGRGARLRRVIVEEGVEIPAGTQIGFTDESLRFTTSPAGITVVGAGYRFDEPIKVRSEPDATSESSSDAEKRSAESTEVESNGRTPKGKVSVGV